MVFRIHPTFGDEKFPTPCAICVSHQSSRIFNPSGEFRTSTAQDVWGCCWDAVFMGDDAPVLMGATQQVISSGVQSIKIGLQQIGSSSLRFVEIKIRRIKEGVNIWCFYTIQHCSVPCSFGSHRFARLYLSSKIYRIYGDVLELKPFRRTQNRLQKCVAHAMWILFCQQHVFRLSYVMSVQMWNLKIQPHLCSKYLWGIVRVCVKLDSLLSLRYRGGAVGLMGITKTIIFIILIFWSSISWKIILVKPNPATLTAIVRCFYQRTKSALQKVAQKWGHQWVGSSHGSFEYHLVI